MPLNVAPRKERLSVKALDNTETNDDEIYMCTLQATKHTDQYTREYKVYIND
jgi:hypothetical protein